MDNVELKNIADGMTMFPIRNLLYDLIRPGRLEFSVQQWKIRNVSDRRGYDGIVRNQETLTIEIDAQSNYFDAFWPSPFSI